MTISQKKIDWGKDIISFAIGELRCPSLEYVYAMTWAEFQIRAYAYLRIEEQKDLRAREIAWASLMAFNVDPKTLPKSKERFWRIGKQEPILTDVRKNAILKAQKEYIETIKK